MTTNEDRKTYTATTAQGMNIISVIAASTQEAAEMISNELQRPGRYQYYDRWINDGKLIITR